MVVYSVVKSSKKEILGFGFLEAMIFHPGNQEERPSEVAKGSRVYFSFFQSPTGRE